MKNEPSFVKHLPPDAREEMRDFLTEPRCWICDEAVPQGTPAVRTGQGNVYHLECIARVATMEPVNRARYLASIKKARKGGA